MPRGRPPKSQAGLKGRANGLRVIDRKPIRPLERQKMRPWLVDLLDQGVCNQLAWYKKRENLFRIMWKHAAGQTFNATCDASLFQRWAEHTGKFVQGDKPDAKKWKANFRCALHSLPDVEEDRDLRVKRGNNAFRVYKFLDSKKAKKTAPKKTEQPKNVARRNARVEDGGCSDGYSPSHDGSHSDWDMRSEDREAVENLSYDEESDEQGSPLPKFEEICPFAVKSTKFPVAIPMISSSPTDDGRSYHLNIYQTDDSYQIVHQGWEAEDSGHSIEEYEFDPEPELDLDVQEEVVCSNTDVCSSTDGPHVVVMCEMMPYYGEYTSMDLTEDMTEI
ncbi:interferon regulatory factor 1-like [Dreissena polymorpha]|uniref:IRF tryptophan pentad repeat domain-containing protein n=1 Tax=Dreissena polymorpha TaxID=45954 RepID=A0A9D4RAY8_DREPO|nr:interferon regulatory factor 1-like [Dreissena polymorpha]XP_052261697.1 interferon regulatory factor 1-like [Dreissena polymorpha]KAH3860773.1 hypothetical protein DPMN_023696 [Dreissena polymorpha]